MIRLHDICMTVRSTAPDGVIDSGTRLRFSQKGSRVLGRYRGGSIARGYLVGDVSDARLTFRYTQVETTGEIHGGRSVCDVSRLSDGRLEIVEHFRWRTREGAGSNVFEQVAADR